MSDIDKVHDKPKAKKTVFASALSKSNAATFKSRAKPGRTQHERLAWKSSTTWGRKQLYNNKSGSAFPHGKPKPLLIGLHLPSVSAKLLVASSQGMGLKNSI